MFTRKKGSEYLRSRCRVRVPKDMLKFPAQRIITSFSGTGAFPNRLYILTLEIRRAEQSRLTAPHRELTDLSPSEREEARAKIAGCPVISLGHTQRRAVEVLKRFVGASGIPIRPGDLAQSPAACAYIGHGHRFEKKPSINS